jgi:hypothetical protein
MHRHLGGLTWTEMKTSDSKGKIVQRMLTRKARPTDNQNQVLRLSISRKKRAFLLRSSTPANRTCVRIVNVRLCYSNFFLTTLLFATRNLISPFAQRTSRNHGPFIPGVVQPGNRYFLHSNEKPADTSLPALHNCSFPPNPAACISSLQTPPHTSP